MPIPAYRSITLDNSASTLLNLFTAFFAFMLLASGAEWRFGTERFMLGAALTGSVTVGPYSVLILSQQ